MLVERILKRRIYMVKLFKFILGLGRVGTVIHIRPKQYNKASQVTVRLFWAYMNYGNSPAVVVVITC